MTYKPHILVTNDDGIFAPGLKYLWEALAHFADLSIIAPSSEQSAVGLGVTIRDPLQFHKVEWEDATPAWKVTGTPADCVRLGVKVILNKKPDLIVSGINRGANSGRNVLYSGTIGGVIEGVLRGIPGIAFSCSSCVSPNYRQAQGYLLPLVQYVLEHPLPQGTLLNVNFPEAETIQGIKMARQGRGYWVEELEERVHPEGHSYYWMGGTWSTHEEHAESDVALLHAGYAAVVPIHVDEMTDQELLCERKERFDARFTDSPSTFASPQKSSS